MDKNTAVPKQDSPVTDSADPASSDRPNPAAAPFIPRQRGSSNSFPAEYRQHTSSHSEMPPPHPATPSSPSHRPSAASSSAAPTLGTMAPPPNPQLRLLPLVPRLPVLQPAPFVPPSIPPIQPNPSTANNIARLAAYAHPHYTTYPLNPLFTHASAASNLYPIQPQRPPILVPNHPLFVYYGRDLSSPSLPLPRHYDGRQLFFRPGDGNVTDEGFGPGVFVHPVVKGVVAETERANMESIVQWDRQRMG